MKVNFNSPKVVFQYFSWKKTFILRNFFHVDNDSLTIKLQACCLFIGSWVAHEICMKSWIAASHVFRNCFWAQLNVCFGAIKYYKYNFVVKTWLKTKQKNCEISYADGFIFDHPNVASTEILDFFNNLSDQFDQMAILN